MKIGAFAKHFDISIDTVRYYVDLGLLIPNKKESQLQFDQNCLEDMQMIIELKKLRFTLQEIHKVLSLRRITQFSDIEDLHFYVTLLQEKQRQLQEERDQLDHSIDMLAKKIEAVGPLSPSENRTGVPLAFIPLLACPHCQKSLNLRDAYIQNQYVLHAELDCPCGYQAEIREGIVITTSPSLDPSKLQYYLYDQNTLEDLDPSLVSLWEKGSLWIYRRLMQDRPANRVVLETNVDVYVLPPKYFASMPADTRYIFAGNGVTMMTKLKSKIEQSNPGLQALYIVNSDMMLPIRYNCVDLFLDTISFNDFSLFHHTYPLERLQHYLTANALILGNYMYYSHGAKSLANVPRLYPDPHPLNFLQEYLDDQMKQYDFMLAENELIGLTTNPGKYLDYHVDREKLYMNAYMARRKA
ncbi:MerR family transcriptional regulator [Brevibacillus fluminis]|uniref:MerR family transcriptional regulator n=1 Tax=Brevibacillus fluminis TaxID=511487 RepID=UPI003F89DAC0